MDVGAWSCGMVAGLIDDVPTCAELIERTMRQAKALILSDSLRCCKASVENVENHN